MVPKHFLFELTDLLLNYDRVLTLLHTARVVTCVSILLNTKHTKEWKYNNSQYALTLIPASVDDTCACARFNTFKQIRSQGKTLRVRFNSSFSHDVTKIQT